MNTQKKLVVCPSPALMHTLKVEDSIVVVIDILRATTSICVAFDHGAKEIIPVETVEECQAFKNKGYILAAERDGLIVEGFDKGNSPFSFMGEDIKNASIAMTTTNGTKCIQISKNAKEIVCGSFANMTILCDYLRSRNENIILLCAGWKDKLNLEDTAFAGAIASELENQYFPSDDSTRIAMTLYRSANTRKRFYIKNATHFERLIRLKLVNDVKYCLKKDLHPVLPVFKDGRLIDISDQFAASKGIKNKPRRRLGFLWWSLLQRAKNGQM